MYNYQFMAALHSSSAQKSSELMCRSPVSVSWVTLCSEVLSTPSTRRLPGARSQLQSPVLTLSLLAAAAPCLVTSSRQSCTSTTGDPWAQLATGLREVVSSFTST